LATCKSALGIICAGLFSQLVKLMGVLKTREVPSESELLQQRSHPKSKTTRLSLRLWTNLRRYYTAGESYFLERP